MRNVNSTPLASASVSSTTAYNSNKVDGQLLVAGSFQAIVTGTATGALKVQVSNDVCQAQNMADTFTPANWTDLASATVSVSGAGSYLIPKLDLSYRWIRVVYTNATNTGTVSVQFNGIGF